MNRNLLPLVAILFSVCVLLVGFSSAGNVGRYQLVPSNLGGLSLLHRLDTVTGQIAGFTVPSLTDAKKLGYGHFASVTQAEGIPSHYRDVMKMLCDPDFIKLSEDEPESAINVLKDVIKSRSLCSIASE